jgi:hypothetical protein
MGDLSAYYPILLAFLPVIPYLVLSLMAARRLRKPDHLSALLVVFLLAGLGLEAVFALSTLGWVQIGVESLLLITQVGAVALLTLMAQMIRVASIPMARNWPFLLAIALLAALVCPAKPVVCLCLMDYPCHLDDFPAVQGGSQSAHADFAQPHDLLGLCAGFTADK